MKKVIAAMIGIAFAFCCFMLFTGCMKAKANEVYYPTYEEVAERDMLDSDFGHDYDSYVIIEEPMKRTMARFATSRIRRGG